MSRVTCSLRPLLAVVACSLVVAGCAATPGGGGTTPTPPSSTASAPAEKPTEQASATPSQDAGSASSTSTGADLPPQPGEVVAREDFSNAANHRFGTDGGSVARNEVTDGVYRMLLMKRDMPYGQLVAVEGRPSTVSIALDMSMSGSESGTYMGPLCYFQQKFGFSLTVHPDGAYELVQINAQGEEVATLADGKGSPLERGTAVRLRLDCSWGLDAATATGWVGTTKVGAADDVEPSDNALREWAATGFWAMNTSQSSVMKVEVDNVVLTQLER